MKKLWIALTVMPLILAIGYTGVAWNYGRNLEQASENKLQLINDLLSGRISEHGFAHIDTLKLQSDTHIEVKQTSYKRGIFSSEAEYQISESSSPMVTIVMLGQHGPWTSNGLGQYSATYRIKKETILNQVFEFTQGKDPLILNLSRGFGKDLTVKFELSPYQYNLDNLEIEFSGLTSTFYTDIQLENFNGDMKMDALSINFNSINVEFKKYSTLIRNAQRIGEFYEFSGKTQTFLDQFSVNAGSGKSIMFGQISIHSNTITENNNIDSNVIYEVKSLKLNDNNFGHIKWDQSFKHFNILAFQKMLQSIKTNKTETIQAGMEILKANPEWIINELSWTTPKGKSMIKTAINLTAPMDLTPETLFFTVLKPNGWKEFVNKINVDLSLSKAMINNIVASLAQLGGK